MEYLINTILIAVLGVVIYQDFRYRAVSWIVFLVLFIVSLIVGLGEISAADFVQSSLINLGILAIIFAGLTLYFSLKEGKLVYIINKYIGVGDLLLFVILAILFSPANFILFYTISLLLTVLGSAAFILFKKDNKAEIPLAGAFSIVLIACLIYAGLNGDINLYDDGLVLELLNPFLFTT